MEREHERGGTTSGVAGGPGFTIRDTLSWTWQIWMRNALPLLACALLLSAPGQAYLFVPKAGEPLGRAGLSLLTLALLLVSMFGASGAIALAGLRTLHGEPLRVGALAAEGLRRTWLSARVFFLSVWVPMLVTLVPGALLWQRLRTLSSAGPRGATWPFAALLWLAFAAGMAWYYPALPLSLLQPAQGARAALRRALEFTRGARLRLFLLVICVEAILLPLTAFLRWARQLPEGPTRLLCTVAYVAAETLAGSFTGLLSVAVYRSLRMQSPAQDAGADALARVFE